MFAARTIGLTPKQHAPHADRTKGAIVSLLGRVLPEHHGVVLEVGSGTGQHIVHFAQKLPRLTWQPSDYDQVAIASIESYRREAGLTNLREPLLLEVRKRTWGHGQLDGVLATDVVHVTSWSVCEGLFEGARKHLKPNGVLVICAPFKQRGGFCSTSHATLDAALRARNPDWGLRDLEAVAALGTARGLLVEQVVDLPDGDLAAVFRKTTPH